MDWTLTSALGAVAILAIAVAYEFSVIPRYSPEPAKQHQTMPILIPAPDRAVIETSSKAPAIGYALQPGPIAEGYAPAPQASTSRLSNTTEPLQNSSRAEVGRAKDQPLLPVYATAAHNEV